ncbi:MAG: DUF1501 domain-containing protein, partial [Bacteroidota bacterium]
MKRRHFLRNTALASTSLMVPAFLKSQPMTNLLNGNTGKILVVVQLSGGNDGLNTIIPYRNDLYYRNRPTLAIQPEKVLPLSDDQGLHPALAALQPIHDQGLLSIINSVGYPNPDRSHFRSMDIWHTASASHEFLTTGWLGRYLDGNCGNCQIPHHALEVDDSLSLALKGRERTGFAMSDPKRLHKTTNNRFLKALTEHQQEHAEAQVAYLYKTMIDTQSSARYLFEQSKVHRSKGDYPRTGFGKDLRQVAELMTAKTNTTVYYLSLGGFDTHANQEGRQARLLRQYAEGMAAFVKDLQHHNLLKDTLILTFSEFGRRVKQNASKGTDHGTANNVLMIGGSLQQKGFYNPA